MSKTALLPITISLLVLFSFNLLMVSSVAPAFLPKQFISWLIAIFAFFIGKQTTPQRTYPIRWLLFIGSCVLLLTPIFLNTYTRGSRRWIDLGFTTFQPSEVTKPFMMLFISHGQLALIHLIPVFIIMAQPDLGSAISFLLLLTPVVLYNRQLLKIALVSLVILTAISPLIWTRVFHDYQRQRILNFINPRSDPLGKGYNVIQSKIAIGSGGLLGKGYKKGTQGQLLFLPEKHTDFIISATIEETGLLGLLIIIGAYFTLIKNLFSKAFSTTNNRSLFFFTLGIAIQIWAQLVINIGMNLGLLPVTGIPLPFLSVGGSSVISLLFSLGIIYSS
ncbi:MAG: FtsW/RodA/SpoVE family cell cycle protein [Candidatus Shapirobacteria bacterium]|jgi:rod shape determining protein RodA